MHSVGRLIIFHRWLAIHALRCSRLLFKTAWSNLEGFERDADVDTSAVVSHGYLVVLIAQRSGLAGQELPFRDAGQARGRKRTWAP